MICAANGIAPTSDTARWNLMRWHSKGSSQRFK